MEHKSRAIWIYVDWQIEHRTFRQPYCMQALFAQPYRHTAARTCTETETQNRKRNKKENSEGRGKSVVGSSIIKHLFSNLELQLQLTSAGFKEESD